MGDNQTFFNVRFQSLAKATLGNGVILLTVASGSLKASQRAAGANMSVDVAAGVVRINGTRYTEAGVTNLIVSAADVTNPRIDLIVYDQSAGNPAIVAGTPSVYPQVPDVTDDLDIPLALVYVAANETEITDAEITDIRSGVKPDGKVPDFATQEFIATWRYPKRITGDGAEGSYFGTTSLSYVGSCFVLEMTLPTNPISGTTMVARLCAVVSISDATGAVTVGVNRNGTMVGETTSQSIYPIFVMSTELSTGPGNNIQTGGFYNIVIKTANTLHTAKLFDAWIEFYAKTA